MQCMRTGYVLYTAPVFFSSKLTHKADRKRNCPETTTWLSIWLSISRDTQCKQASTPYCREKGPMGGAPYIGPILGDRPIPGIRGISGISVTVRRERVPR